MSISTISGSMDDGRASLRLRLRELIDEAEQENISTLLALNEKLDTMNDLYEQGLSAKTSRTREVAMDSGLLSQYTKLGHRAAQSLDTNLVTFISLELTSRLKVFMRSDEDCDDQDNLSFENWAEFGKTANKLFKRPPSYNFLLGTFPKFEAKVVRERKPKDKAIIESQKTAPENISAMGTSNQEVTSEEVERVLSVLRSTCKQFGPTILFFEFVIDPNSFTRTVENIFHVSFLIKNGFVKLDEDEDELLTLEVIQNKKSKSSSNNLVTKNETLLSITQKDWREIVKAYKIEKAVLNPRSNSNKRSSD